MKEAQGDGVRSLGLLRSWWQNTKVPPTVDPNSGAPPGLGSDVVTLGLSQTFLELEQCPADPGPTEQARAGLGFNPLLPLSFLC